MTVYRPEKTIRGTKMGIKLSFLMGLLLALALCAVTVTAQDSTLHVVGIGTVQVPADAVIIQ